MTDDERAQHDVAQRAEVHAALGDPVRLAVVDALAVSDRSPVELRRRLGLESNLLAHHLDVLEAVGLVERSRSSGDGRRRYVHLRVERLGALGPVARVEASPVLFVCSANSARSQLAAALWAARTGAPARSAGTHPAPAVHPGAVAAARRVGLDLRHATPTDLATLSPVASLVVTVCDRAHEELDPDEHRLHWSVPDPVAIGSPAAFDAALDELRRRVETLARTPALAAAS